MIFSAPKAVPDVLWPQLKRASMSMGKQLGMNGFSLISSELWTDEKKKCALLFELEVHMLPKVVKVQGPEVHFDAQVENFVKKGPVEGLWILPAGPVPPHPSELLGSPAMKGRLEEIASKFDRVVIDSPPVCAVTDACVVAPHVDAHVMVVQPGLTARAGLSRAMGLLKRVGTVPVGLVLNKVPERAEGYYAYYKYYGYYKKSAAT